LKESHVPSHAWAVAQRLARTVAEIVKRCIAVPERYSTGSDRSVSERQKSKSFYLSPVFHL
jgi:hypothetical protein